VRLNYPRDIATLRSAYERQAILGTTKPQSNTNAPSTTLRGDLSEPASGDHDTVRSYGGQLTPLAQESVLLDIANRLSEKRIQFIILRSTSSLDQIFLSEFLRRAYPEGRVVIDGADLLFTRGADGKSMRGVMALSTYPLLTVEQDWTPSLGTPRTTGYKTFGEDASEGTYIAARELFRNEEPSVPIHDYTAPSWAVGPGDNAAEDKVPPTWLTVIGRRQFWPIAVLNSNTVPAMKNAARLPEALSEPEFLQDNSKPVTVPTVMWLFLIACASWSALHLYLCRTGSIKTSPRARAYFVPLPLWQHPALIALGSLLLAMLAVVVGAASGLFSWLAGADLYPGTTGVFLAISVFSSLVLSALSYLANGKLKLTGDSDSRKRGTNGWYMRAGLTAILCLAIFAFAHIVLIHRLTRANSVPAYLRGVNLLSGVSPLLPQLLLIAGAYLWFWCTLRGLALFGDDRPRLPRECDLPELAGKPVMSMFSRERAGDVVEDVARPLTGGYLKQLLIVFTVTAAICWLALQGLWVRTLGERAFGILIFLWVSFFIAVILTDGIEMWRAWSELRQLLVFLDRLPLRRTLRALKGLAWGSIWKLSGDVLGERYRVVSRQLESLTHLTNTMKKWQADSGSPEESQKTAVLRQVATCQEKREAFTKWYVNLPAEIEDLTPLRDLLDELAQTAGLLMKLILLPAWHKEEESLIFYRCGSDDKPSEGEGSEAVIPGTKLTPHVQAAEEFVVLPYLAFIQNILGRLRTIALGGLWLFVGATFAVSSYPFDPLNVLGAIFLAVFVIAGGLMVVVYSQMSRDATLSHITDTKPGELGMDFWMKLVTFGVGPLIGLLTTLFPSITDFAFSWLQPSVQALK
jgi:hypothetical protein